MKKVLFVFLLSIAPLFMYADTLSDALEITANSGTKTTFVFDEEPVVNFSGDEILVIVKTPGDPFVISINDVLSMQFVSVTSGIAATEAEAEISIADGHIAVRSPKPGVAVRVFDGLGRATATKLTDSAGCATISIASLPHGMSIIKVNKTTFKFTRK